MPLTGYTDFQRVSYNSGYDLATIFQPVTASLIVGSFNVSAWNSILCDLSSDLFSDNYLVLFSWFNDRQLTFSVGYSQVVLRTGSISKVAIPVLGPFVQIEISPKVGGNNANVQAFFYGLALQSSAFDLGVFTSPLVYNNTALAANGSTTVETIPQYYGRAKLNASRSSTGGFSIQVQYWDWNSASWLNYEYFPSNSATGSVDEEIAMMATGTRLLISNGATAQTVLTTLVPVP